MHFAVSNLSPSKFADLVEMPDGLRVTIAQGGRGQGLLFGAVIRLRPVEPVQTWLAAAPQPIKGIW